MLGFDDEGSFLNGLGLDDIAPLAQWQDTNTISLSQKVSTFTGQQCEESQIPTELITGIHFALRFIEEINPELKNCNTRINQNGETILHAVLKKLIEIPNFYHEEIFHAFVFLWADLTVIDVQGRTLFHHLSINTKDSHCLIPLFKESGIDINQKDKHQRTAFQYAFERENIIYCNELMRSGASAIFEESHGNTKLHYAAMGLNLSSEITGNANALNKKHETPLHTAIRFGQWDFAEKILSCHPDTEIRDSDGNTPLLLACSKYGTEVSKIFSILLEMGANVFVRNNKNETVEHVLSRAGCYEKLQLIQKRKKDLIEENRITPPLKKNGLDLPTTKSIASSSISDVPKHTNNISPIAIASTKSDDLEILDNSSSTTASSSSTHLITSSSACVVNSHIAEKYQGGVLPRLPAPASDEHRPLPTYSNNVVFQTLEERQTLGSLSSDLSEVRTFPIEYDFFKADLHTTQNPITPYDQVTFVIAGRKQHASIPDTNGRCVLVLTQDEYDEIKTLIPDTVDALVMHKLGSPTHGSFTENLHFVTPRRLAIFLMAHLIGLRDFCMMDDNLASVQFNHSKEGDFDTFYKSLKNNMGKNGCISVATLSSRELKDEQLGCKLFLINMAIIKMHLPDMLQMFYLLPTASQTKVTPEDYYFEMFLMLLLEKTGSQGHITLEKEQGTLTRKRTGKRNAAVSTGIRCVEFEKDFCADLIHSSHLELLSNTVDLLNEIIRNNREHYQNRVQHLEQTDIFRRHHWAHGYSNSPSSPEQIILDLPEGDFISRVKQQLIKKIQNENESVNGMPFQPHCHQIESILAFAHSTNKMGYFNIATGCGKSLIQYLLAIYAYEQLNEGETIAIVTPQIEIVKQLYAAFMKYHTIFHHGDRVPAHRIATVSSHTESINLAALVRNQCSSTKKSILIFCADSFSQYCRDNETHHIKLITLDEFHDYTSFTSNIISKVDTDDTLILGFSATPTHNTILKHCFFEFTLEDGIKNNILSPFEIKRLGKNYSIENVQAFIQSLPEFMTNLPIQDRKTMIFLPSIAHDNLANDILVNNNFKVALIHSKSTQSLRDTRDAQVIVVCGMLQFGFDDNHVYNVVILRQYNKARDPKHQEKMVQMIGRGVRRDETRPNKIATIYTFDDNVATIPESLRDCALLSDDSSQLVFTPSFDFQGSSNKRAAPIVIEIDSSDDAFQMKRPCIGAGLHY